MQNTNPKTTRPGKKDDEAIKLPILAPLFVAIAVLLAIFTLAIYRLQQQNITDDFRMRLDSSNRHFKQLLFADARLIGETTHFVKDNPDIQNAWLAKDRDKLLGLTTPLYEKLRRDYRITHLYFIDINNICFLRVHNPTRFGDRLERFTLDSAARTTEPSRGIELGPYGTFTLRVVQPWFVNNTLTGFIEFGEEIDHIALQLKETLNIDLVFLIDKTFLARDNWEEGLKMMGHSGNWDLIPDCVIADSTIPSVPPEFIKLAGLTHSEHKDKILSAKLDSSTYRAGFIKLSDTAGREVGDILVIKNVSNELASLRALLVVIATLCFLIASALVSFFYIHITGIEKRLIHAHASLATEIVKRKETEAELRKHRDNLEKTVKNRTAELEETNIHLHEENIERKKAEETSQQERDFSQAVLDSLPGLFYMFDNQGRFLRVNKNFEKVSGYSADELYRMTPLELFGETDKRNLADAIQRVFQTGEATVEADFLSKNQTKTPYFFTGKLFQFDQKSCLIGMGIDITERKRAEENLKSSLSLLSASLESTADGILVVDRKGKLTRWNQKFADMWKIPEEVLSSRDDEKTINHILGQLAVPEQFVAKVKKLYEHPEESSFDQIEFLDGRVFDRYSQPQRIGDDIVGRVWSFRDITERKKAEQRQTQLLEQLEKSNRHLQQENTQRIKAEESLEKLNDDLEFTVAQLSQSNKQLREFDHLAAHDLKTPLRGIGTLAQWLLEDYYDKFDNHGRKQVDLLVKRVMRIDDLINAILQYSTIARNKQNEHQVDLNPLIKSVIADFQPTTNITITVNKNLPVLACEEEQIRQVFYNLVANAVKFADKPDGCITIDCEDEKYFWKFSVADNGPGIEPQHFERIFRLFQTLSDREEAESIGIGLTIARKIVELYSGKIWLTSTVGVGSTFFFTLPKQPTAVPCQSTQQAHA